MEQHLIPLHQGIHLTPSVGEEGQLIDCINLMPKNGSLRNAPQLEQIPDIDLNLQDDEKLLYIHTTADNVTHYIVQRYYSQPEKYMLVDIVPSEGGTLIGSHQYTHINKITSIGNTLIVSADDLMHYIIWESGQGYSYLGTHFPEISLYFECDNNSETKEFSPGYFTFTEWSIDDSYITPVSNATHGAINKMIAEEITGKGLFAHPFFVRYAYRLYDGSLTMHSAPILIRSTVDLLDPDNPIDFNISVESLQTSVNFDPSTGTGFSSDDYPWAVSAVTGKLKYILSDNTEINNIKQWKDIISSVDIFVSQPLYLYNTSENITTLHADDPTVRVAHGIFDLPEYRTQRYIDLIKHTGNFYLIDSINIEAFDDTYEIPDLEGKLDGLVNREQMTDDYDSHDIITPEQFFVYNNRLNIAHISKKIFEGFTARQLNFISQNNIDKITIAVTYSINGKTIVTRHSDEDVIVPAKWYYYNPNPNALSISMVWQLGAVVSYKTVKLVSHNLLNGTYALVDDEDWIISARSYQETCADTSIIPAATDNTISLPNKIYTSEVNNPFFFPVSGINTVGVGEINGICAAVKALSQGQFGQFPLYVFSTDGIWALEVNSDGMYSVKQPVTRDVCNNPKSITQLDNAVLYSTDRGLNVIQGSETRLLTAQLEAGAEDLSDIPVRPFGEEAGIYQNMLTSYTHLLDILKGAAISYDGINNIAHVYPEKVLLTDPTAIINRGHWMLHLDTMEWTRSTEGTPDAFVDGYPNATLQIGESLYEYQRASITASSTLRHGFLITRETAIANPNAHKILNDLRTMSRIHSYTDNGSTIKGKCRVIPYVSNDRTKWYRLNSLKANSWKWYRFAIYTELSDQDTLEGLTLITDLRRTNKLR